MKQLLILFYVFIVSCNVNGAYENREEDKKDAEAITNKFYSFLMQKNYSNSYKLYTRNFFSKTDTNKLRKFYDQIEVNCGQVESYELIDWKTSVIKGTNHSSKYYFIYKVRYTKAITNESIILFKEEDEIRIASYDVKMQLGSE